MCGIAGCFPADEVQPAQFAAMVDAIAHRGPDARGEWTDGRVRLGHRRLSILDLSSAGAQPMANDDESIVATYNGEVYNHLELRKRLPGIAWRGHSDTETLLRLYEAFGPSFIAETNGMFALAIYDSRRGRVHLYRDRLGVKPLYYSTAGGRLMFGSELKALLPHPAFSRQVDEEALRDFFLFNYIPAPRTIWRGVRKLPPGCWLEYDLNARCATVVRWWHPAGCLSAKSPARDSSPREERAKLEELEALLLDCVASRTLSDVPLGCFLSGGVDSSLVAAMLRRASTGTVRTFSIGFADAAYDESGHAARVARSLETEHTALTATEANCLELIPKLPDICDEPFADASILPTTLLSLLTREHVTVSLSGDGGDELFLGYDRYLWSRKVRERAGWIPGPLRHAAAGMLESAPYRVRMQAAAMKFRSIEEIYPYVFMGWNNGFANALTGARRDYSDDPICGLGNVSAPIGEEERAALVDVQHYLPDDILAKVDRASMHASLEAREPLLDYRLLEFAFLLPEGLKIRGGTQKYLLKRVLKRVAPAAFAARPKAGFAVPLKHWFRGKLRPLLWDLLSPAALAKHPFLRASAVRRMIEEHETGRANHERRLFALVVWQLWARKYLP